MYKGLKAVIGFPVYIYKIYSRLASLEAKIVNLEDIVEAKITSLEDSSNQINMNIEKLGNNLDEMNCNVESLQYHAGIKTSITDNIPYEQTLKSILNSDYLFDTFREDSILKGIYEHEFSISQKNIFNIFVLIKKYCRI